jgi:hypothetical protein
MIVATALAFTASTSALLLAGYLFGARRGRGVRASMAQTLDESASRCRELEGAASAATARAQALELDLRTAQGQATDGERQLQIDLERSRAQLLELKQALESARREAHTARRTLTTFEHRAREEGELLEELRRQLEPLRQEQAARGDHEQQLRAAIEALAGRVDARERDDGGLRDQVNELLAPLRERERLSHALARVDLAARGDAALPGLMDAIAEVGGFATVLISDSVGLPLASNTHAIDAETRAGISSLLLTLIDRVEANGQPPPIAAVLRDEDNQLILHRVFHVDGGRFVLTAVSKGGALDPAALDPALTAIERVLARPLAAIA